MKLTAVCAFMGTETITSRDGKIYTMVGVAQGLDLKTSMIDDKLKESVANLPIYSQVEVTFNIYERTDKQTGVKALGLSIGDIQPVPFSGAEPSGEKSSGK